MSWKLQVAQGNNNDGPIVVQVHGFLQRNFPAEIKTLVETALSRINPIFVVTVIPDYMVADCPVWLDYAGLVNGALVPLVATGRRLIVIGDSWATPLMQTGPNLAIEHQMISFRVPRIGKEREALVPRYVAMAKGCSVAEKLAKYRASFPLLPPDPNVAASIFLGAAESGLEQSRFERGNRIIAIEGFHDDTFHPPSALDVVRNSGGRVVPTVESALAALKLH